MVERQLPKLHTRVRFPSPAPIPLACLLRGGLLAGLTALLAGCGSFMPTLTDMSVSHNEAIDRTERNTILMNVLRAADRMPMKFTVLSNLSASGSLVGGVSGGLTAWLM